MFKNFKRKISLIVAGACMLSILPVSESNHITAEEKIEDKTTATTVSETITEETEEVEVLFEEEEGWCGLTYTITSDGVLTVSDNPITVNSNDSYLYRSVRTINMVSEVTVFNQQINLEGYDEMVTTIKFADEITTIPDYIFAQSFPGYEEYNLTVLNTFPNLETVILSNTSQLGDYCFYGLEIENFIVPAQYSKKIYYSDLYYFDIDNIYIYNSECNFADSEKTFREVNTIYGYENSTAYDYAKKYGRTFYAFDKEEPLLTAPAVTTTITTASTTTTTVTETTTTETEEVEVLHEYYNGNIKYVITSDGVLTISGDGEMHKCYDIYVEEINPQYSEAYFTNLQPYLYKYSEQVKTIKFEDGVTQIADYLFAQNFSPLGYEEEVSLNKFPNLETVILSNTSIVGRNSFYGLEIENLIVPSEYENYYVLYNGYLDINNVYFYNPECNIGDTESTVNPKAIIHGYENSTAYDYAKKYGRTFYAFDNEEPLLTAPAVTTTITTASTTTTTVTETTTAVSTTVSTTVSKTASNTTSASKTVSDTVSTTVSTTVSETTTSSTTTVTTETVKISGDANGDNKLDVRDCAYIASMLASGTGDKLPKTSDFNGDGVVNVRDAAAIAKKLADKNI